MPLRPISVFLVACAGLAGCQVAPVQQVPYSFTRGGALSAEEYGILEPYVRSRTFSSRINVDLGQRPPAAGWAYAFAPGFDPRSIMHVSVGEFTGRSPATAAVGAALVPYLRSRLDSAGVPALAAGTDPATGFTISGAVTRDEPLKDADGDLSGRKVQVEARIRQGGRSVGAIQVNFLLPRHQTQIIPAPGTALLGSLIARAIEPDIAENRGVGERAGLFLANPFYQVKRDGAAQGISPVRQTTVFEPAAAIASGAPVARLPGSP